MKKCCFIVAYFGKLPNYFQLFLKTCSYNKNFNWLLFTDDNTDFDYPDNVEKIQISFEELHEIVQSKFDFHIKLDKAYKLCDFKPAYGYIFEEYISDYMFWGHCDIDTLMGNLDNFITDDILSKYDKIFALGHMVLYKNSFENNRIFMTDMDNQCWYKESFTNSEVTIFDEPYKNSTNINEIFKATGSSVLDEDWSINFKVIPTKFVKTTYVAEKRDFIDDSLEALYVWDNGKILRYTLVNGILECEEYMYVHLQERNMRFIPKILKCDKFKIVPNSFLELEVDQINVNNYPKIKKYSFNTHFLQFHIKWKTRKLKRILGIK